MTKRYGYITLRYTKDQIEGVRSGNRRIIKAITGLSGGVARSVTNHPDALAGDQLYDLEKDPRAQRNLAGKPQFKDTLQRMREKLTSVEATRPTAPA